ncbi:glycosyltransferase family 2 protein [Alkalihalobacterium alkalinitrilicum]|uniref:glycosyltransferase family 2 protein n=1 Tax=Alkalihalobacterium alkalinitrilicum TaxID=427920 RepID=UPI00099556E5|nr:glycosyltransferase family 2 protein [Alkalihalobacterium alkalinitrilicum]
MLVSFIVVALNAGDKLNSLIEDIKKQDYDHGNIEVIFVDGNSTDNTKEVMTCLQNSSHDFNRVCVLDNPKKTLPCGWNIALKESKGDIILRVDAHSSIPTNFIKNNVECLKTGEKIVGGHRISIIDEKSSWQKTLLIAETSLFGSGIASYRRTKEKNYVSTLAHAAYSIEVFQKVGGYDERLARTEDNEIHYRMKVAGYKFLLNPKIQSFHHARNTFSKMLKQKFLNGYWIGLTLGISPKCFSTYHFVPLLFVLAIIFGIGLGLYGITLPITVLASIYFSFNILNTAASTLGKKFEVSYLLLPFLFLLLHVYYGIGTLWGIIKLPLWKEKSVKFEPPNIIR